MKSIRLFVILIFLSSTNFTFAQPWQINIDGIEEILYITEDVDNNNSYNLIGRTPNNTFAKVNFNEAGEVLSFTEINIAQVIDVKDSKDDGLITASLVALDNTARIMKLDNNGVVLWENDYTHSDSLSFVDVYLEVFEENIVLVGRTLEMVPYNESVDDLI